MKLSLIWAMARNRVIGRDNDLPWDLPADMKHFISTTKGKPVIMGRKTYQSMPGALPNRHNIIMTRDTSFHADDATVVADLDSALEVAWATCAETGVDEIMIIGGAEIYAMALPQADRLYMTTVHTEIAGDVLFPEFDLSAWRCVAEVEYQQDDRHAYDFTISTLERA